LNISQIEEIVKKLATDINANEVNKNEFIYQLMAAYGHRKTTIGRIKSGERNLANIEGEVRAKRHIYFKHSNGDEVLSDIDNMKKEASVIRDKIRFVIATDFNQFVALDTRTHDTLDIGFNELGKHFDFFLPWAGMEKAVYQGENPADVKAAEKMAKLFDLIKADNFSEENKDDTNALHNLNVFLTRLLFCFFAEDTGIFKQNQFSAELESHTKIDGSDVDNYLNRLFAVLNTSKETRGDLPDYLTNFEYVNGGLFANTITSPRFSTKSRKMLIECGSELDWSDINPDIFGSMIQAVVHPDQRSGMGMHYTSVTNIMKVIEPLFLDELYAEFENIEDNIDAKLKPSRLRKLHDRISEIKVLDPACGSGNFLIIAFKELRKLEMEIIKRLQELAQNDNQDDLFGEVGLDSSFSRIKLSQFYGIELDDFAHEVAILSLWLAEHQMNVEFKAEFGDCEPSLPLKRGGNIVCGNALGIEWQDVCESLGEVFIIGNPPYLGTKNQSNEQKLELQNCFTSTNTSKHVDYIAAWFAKASRYINDKSSFAFVTTNSISQGAQVTIVWPEILSDDKEIIFAHRDFRWSNNAKSKAAVTCSIIGISVKKNRDKFLFSELMRKKVNSINPYLIDAPIVYVDKFKKPISKIPTLSAGNDPREGGHLIFDENEKNKIISSNPFANKFIKKIQGASDFVKGLYRWCLWISEEEQSEAMQIELIRDKVNKVKLFREGAGKIAYSCKDRPYQFFMHKVAKQSQIVIPFTSSERRDYLPIGILSNDVIVTNALNVLFDPDPYIFGIVSSKMHMIWTKAVSGKMKTDIRYSVGICYNAFPFPEINAQQKSNILSSATEVLASRESYSDKTISELYDPKKMPDGLKKAHESLDRVIENLYSSNGFKNDSERLGSLFSLYKEMTGSQNA
jgi:hypothetical protein